MDSVLLEWLSRELHEREWQVSYVARLGGISEQQLYHFLGKRRGAGLKTCEAIARAFKLPLEEVLEMAGRANPQAQAPP
jgi:DNA-binding phage protein